MEIVRMRIFAVFAVASLALLPCKESARAEAIFHDIRLIGSDLVDDMIYNWIKDQPFSAKQALVLTDVRAPVGLDSSFAVFVENRLFEVLRLNPDVPVVLIHCGLCQEFVVKSTPNKTIMGLAADQPEVITNIAQSHPGAMGLSMAFEAHGQDLVLRAHVFELNSPQRIIWAKTFSANQNTELALQNPDQLLSLEEARATQRKIIEGKDQLEFVTRLTLRLFQSKNAQVQVQPMPFIEQSIDGIPLPNRKTRVGVSVGFTSIRDAYEGWSAGGHVARLMFRDTPHLTDPDLYWFFGFHYVRLRGPGTAPFSMDLADFDAKVHENKEPKASLLMYRLGFELHAKYRMGLMAFIEYTPLLKENEFIKTDKLLGLPYQDYGLGVVSRW